MRRAKAIALVGTLCGVGLAACGGDGSTNSTGGTTTTTRTAVAPATQPGASGTLAAISGSTLEVQNPTSGQVTVILTKSSVISQTVTATAAQVVVGTCVSVTGTTAKSGTITARTVTISTPSSSGCTRNGARDAGGTFLRRPTGSAFSATKPPGVAARFGSAFGKVTATTKTSFIVLGTKRSATTASTTTASPTTASTTVDETASTIYTKLTTGNAATLKVGECVTAIGPTSSIGAVTARELSVRPAGPDGCTTPALGGAGRRGFGGFAGLGGGPGPIPTTSGT
jgi:hypothetical protein